jgi:hypothetical protein
MKRKETAPRGSVEERDMLERIIDKDRPAKRHDIQSRVYGGDTSSSNSSICRGSKDEV